MRERSKKLASRTFEGIILGLIIGFCIGCMVGFRVGSTRRNKPEREVDSVNL